MSLGDLVISLSANTARFDSDMGRAAQLVERWGNSVGNSAKAAELAIGKMSSIGITSIDRLQQSFNTLNIKSGLQIDREAANIQAAFERIKNSGVASANEIARAQTAMKEKLAGLDGSGNMMKGHIEGMNGFSLASVAAIAKIQILYSLINNIMSAIGSMPRVVLEAVDSYQSSIVKNAAIITSMQTNIKDVAGAYADNKAYATSVQDTLVRMSSSTVASAKQLQLMNDQFVLQGVLIDTNNAKQVDGYKRIANALAVITAGDPNKDMQYSQEVRALVTGENRPGDRLFKLLNALDGGQLKTHLEDWKKISQETGNYGLVLEKLAPLLTGFAAASGDIGALWDTVKTTMVTMRDQILRGGLTQGFALIVEKMKEITKYADENKEKIQAWLKSNFDDVVSVAKVFGSMASAIYKVGEPAVWAVITAGMYSVVKALGAIAIEVTTATGGLNLLLAGLATFGMYGAKKYFDNQAIDTRVTNLKAKTLDGKITREQLQAILAKNPMASDEDITHWKEAGAIKFGSNFQMNQMAIDYMKQDKEPVKTPKGIKVGGSEDKYDPSKYNSFIGMFAQALDESIPDSYEKSLGKIQTRVNNLKTAYESMSLSEQVTWTKAMQSEGFEGKANDAFKWIQDKLTKNLQNKETMAMNDLVGSFNGFADRSEATKVERDVAAVQTKLDSWIAKYSSLSQYTKDQMTAKGVTESQAVANAQAEIDRLKGDAADKDKLNSIKVQRQKEILSTQSQITDLEFESKMGLISTNELLENKLNLQRELLAKEQLELSDIPVGIAFDKARNEEMLKLNATQKQILETQKAMFDQTAMGGFSNALKSYAESATNMGEHVKSITTSIFKGMEDALVSFVVNGKLNFKQFADAIISDMVRIFIQQQVTGVLAQGMTNMLAGGYNVPGQDATGPGIYAPTTSPTVMTKVLAKAATSTPGANLSGTSAATASAGNTTFILQNNTGTQMKQRDGGSTFDGKQMVKTIILEALDTDYTFRNAVRG